MINSDSITRSKPISQQVEDLLRDRILQGKYTPDERMPSEARLAHEFNVSRATVRTALAALAAEGLVRRRQGDGTYPTPNVLEISVRSYNAWSIERQIRQTGRTPSIQVLERGLRPASPQECESLELESAQQVFVIRRLFFADDIPVMLAIHVARYEEGQTDIPPNLDQLPLLESLPHYYQHPPHSGTVSFKALAAEEEMAKKLNIEPGSPVLLLEALLLDEQERPLLIAKEFYRGEEGFLLPLAPFRF